MWRILTIVLIITPSILQGQQFTYFSQLTGIQGDQESEQVANVEVLPDGYMVWGGGANAQVGLFHFVRKYSLNGAILGQTTVVYYPEDYLYSGIVGSFQYNPYTDEFIMLQGAETPNGVQGRFLTFNQSIELTRDLYYDLYQPYWTYFFGFHIEPDGYVVFGEQGYSNTNSIGEQAGTFMAKLDYEGNVLWNQVVQPVLFQHIYRNWTIAPLDDGYLLGGLKTAVSNNSGILTKVDGQGNTVQTLISIDAGVPRSWGMFIWKLVNGEYLSSQLLGYEWVEEFGNPNIYWTKTRLRKLNPETMEFYGPVVEHFDNYEFFMGAATKGLPTPDGGIIFVGTNPGYFYNYDAWLQKVDSDGNEEWFKNVNYQTCNDCENILYDIELAPDGGYIAAGYFINWDVDPRSSTWLLKVDACGDLEWQGCSPLNVPERKGQSFAIYPNPSTGRFTVETANQSRAQSYRVYDLSGRLVAQEMLSAAESAFTMDVNLPSGFYTLQVTTDVGNMEAYKIQVVR
jgi:hypothetical protein